MGGSTNQPPGQRTNQTVRARGTIRETWRSIVSTLQVKVLLAFLVVALIPLAILALYNYITTEQALINSANQALFAAASQTAVRLDALITANLSVISTEAQLPILAEYLSLLPDQREDSQVKAQVLDILRTFARKDAVFISSYGLLDLNGRNVIDTDSLNIGGDESARDYFRMALESGLAYVSPVEFAPSNGKACLCFSSVIFTMTGQPVGVLRVSYSAAILQQLVVQDSGLVGPHSYPILLDENGIFLADGLSSPGSPSSLLYTPAVPLDLARTAELEAARRLPPQPGDTLLAQMPGLTDGLARVDSPEPYFTVQRAATGLGPHAAAVTRMKTQPWLVAFLEPQEMLLAPARAQARDTVALAGMIMILVAIAAIGAARFLIYPIVDLTLVARQVAAGNLDAKARVESADEIGVLAEAFNSMTSRLAETLEGLRASEENYRNIFENAVEGVFRGSVEGQLLSANPAMAHILGFDSPDDLVEGLANVVYPEARDAVISAIVEQGIVDGLEFQIRRKDKQTIWASINVRLIRDDAGAPQFIEGFMTDITERKRAEEALRLSEAKYRTLAEASHDIVFIIDSTLRVAYVNSIAAKYLEKELEEIIGLPLVDLFPAAIAEKNNKFLSQLFESATPIYWEAPTWFPQGEVWLGTWLVPLKDDTEIVTQVMGVARDITERKRTEEALAAQEREFRTLAENSPDNIARFDTNGRTVYVNRTLEKTLGLPASKMLGATPTESGNIDDIEKYQEKVFEALETGKEVEADFVKQDRGEGAGYYNVRFVAERGADGAITGVLAIGRDVTERVQAEAEIRLLNQELGQRVLDRTAQLEASNKELADFSYSISHDLRAPIRHIDGFLELLQKKTAGSLDAQSRRYMANISASSKHMGTLIDSILSFYRMRRNEISKVQVDLNGLVQEAIRELEPETHGRAIDWRIADLPVVTGDYVMLHMVLVNLISNALKFTRPREQAEIEIGCQAGEKETIVFIRDNGVGFDMTYVDKLFGVFHRLHRADDFEGIGIGLANVRRIITRHGGRTWAEGEKNQGATFYFSLP